ncbi:hypothetical protein SEA_JOURNEY13_77 [Mycobacterium phage Journey13]|nr:hypothetical protein SEA_JOURNEY13_77 [Mycobacterium phage Journey13]
MAVYHVCDTCAAAVINNDYSAFDLYDDDTTYERVTAFVDSAGYLTDAGRVSMPGYWGCEACWDTQIGSANALEELD